MIQLSFIDRCLIEADKALRTLAPGASQSRRPSPARDVQDAPMEPQDQRHAAGLMRVNHTGEVCAQALYQGQALTAKLPAVRQEMASAAEEEIDHLAWCEERLRELRSRPSLLNPLWYGMSFAIGAGAGLISDRVSLGFVAATEDQVCKHLDSHLASLPADDNKSRAVISQMRIDEARHAESALAAGGLIFPAPMKRLMSLSAKLMTKSSYRL